MIMHWISYLRMFSEVCEKSFWLLWVRGPDFAVVFAELHLVLNSHEGTLDCCGVRSHILSINQVWDNIGVLRFSGILCGAGVGAYQLPPEML